VPLPDPGLARRLASVVLVGLLVSAGCVLAGRWQWGRFVTRSDAARVVERNYDAPAVALDTLLPRTGSAVTDSVLWHPVTVTGHYEPARTVLLRNRPVLGLAAFQVLVPFVVDGAAEDVGTATPLVVIVDRGWVATDSAGGSPAGIPPPPAGAVRIVVRLRAEEPSMVGAAPAGQTYRISRADLLSSWGSAGPPVAVPWTSDELYAAYGILASEDPAPTTPLVLIPAPDTSTGPHLSYAFQWWVFATGALVGAGLLARREILDLRPPHPAPADETGSAARPPVPAGAAGATPAALTSRRSRRPTAEEE
jgi:cytochrome oxidase assembly protein ShyY1